MLAVQCMSGKRMIGRSISCGRYWDRYIPFCIDFAWFSVKRNHIAMCSFYWDRLSGTLTKLCLLQFSYFFAWCRIWGFKRIQSRSDRMFRLSLNAIENSLNRADFFCSWIVSIVVPGSLLHYSPLEGIKNALGKEVKVILLLFLAGWWHGQGQVWLVSHMYFKFLMCFHLFVIEKPEIFYCLLR